jgi:hypothetical protein
MEGGTEDALERGTFKVVAKRDELKGGHKGVVSGKKLFQRV